MIYSIRVQYDQMTDDVEAQVIRDLMILKGNWKDIWVNDPKGLVDEGLLAQIDVHKTPDPPVLIINYKVGPDFLPTDPHVETVERDLSPPDGSQQLDSGPHAGYYLRPQGRDGASLTEIYLNRAYPRGNGITDPLVVWLWS